LVRMEPGRDKPLSEIQKRFAIYYGEDRKLELTDERVPALRKKWGSLSEFVKEIKQGFSRFYNRRHRRKGFFWSERFKSVIVDNGETLINCLACIDLNSIRAGIAKKPEEYRWCSLGYHAQTNNHGQFLSTDFGLREFAIKDEKVRLAHYRRFIYEKGGLMTGMEDQSEGPSEIRSAVTSELHGASLDLSSVDRFRYRTRYFTDSGIIGTKEFVPRIYQDFKGYFTSRHEKHPKPVVGLDGIYSLKRLSEKIV